MSSKFFSVILIASFAVVSPSLAQIESGGWAKSVTIYKCVEQDAKDANNPVEAILTKELGDVLLLRVGTKLEDPFAEQMIYSNAVQPSTTAGCMDCDVYENQQDGVSFGVTFNLNETVGLFGRSNKTTFFNCSKMSK